MLKIHRAAWNERLDSSETSINKGMGAVASELKTKAFKYCN